VVDLVQTQNDKGYAIKNAPKISHWDMKSVNMMYGWVEKHNLQEYSGQEFVDLLERSFSKTQIYNLKVMINAKLRSLNQNSINFADYNFETLRQKIESAIPTSMTTDYYSSKNTTEQNLLCMTGELIPISSEQTQIMVEKINSVVEKLDVSYQEPGLLSKDAIMKWAKKMKPNKGDHKWSEQDVQQYKDNWLKKVLYNNKPAIDSNCIDNFDDLCINLHGYMGDMKAVEAQYFAYHPYAHMQKVDQTPNNDANENIKKRMNENQKGKPKESFKTPKILCYQWAVFIMAIVYLKIIRMLIRIRK